MKAVRNLSLPFLFPVTLLLSLLLSSSSSSSSPPLSVVPTCPSKPKSEHSNRSLYVVSFDNRGPNHYEKVMRGHGSRFGAGLADITVLGRNCSWQPMKFFNKPLFYSRWLNDTIKRLTEEGKDPNDAHAIMLDTDTILNARPLHEVWDRYDCARKGKPILMGGETSCWYGLQCKQKHVTRFYEPLGPSLNTFINSGYIMGTLPALQTLFSYISNNYAFFRRIIYWVHWFCDQSSFTYFYGTNRDLVQIDDYQQVFGTLSVFSDVGHTRSSNYVCKSHTSRQVVNNCSQVLLSLKDITVHPHTCVVSLKTPNDEGVMSTYIGERSPDPIVFHGNGLGKRILNHIAPKVRKCLLKKYGVTNFTGDFVVDGV